MASHDSIQRLSSRTDLTGISFSQWTVLQEAAPRNSRRYWTCICDCGTKAVVDGKELRLGRSTSCVRCRNKTHGKGNCPEYIVWKRMRSRCRSQADKNYARYGGRGIDVCVEWESFATFYRDMGQRPTPKHTIERVKNDLGYSKNNCRWATRREQACNTSRNRLLTFNGVTQSIPDWAETLGISGKTLAQRLRMGWSVERTLTTPLQRNHVRSPSAS